MRLAGHAFKMLPGCGREKSQKIGGLQRVFVQRGQHLVRCGPGHALGPAFSGPGLQKILKIFHLRGPCEKMP